MQLLSFIIVSQVFCSQLSIYLSITHYIMNFCVTFFHAGGIVNNTLRPTIPNYCDAEWRTLMEECWAPNPTARPSFTEIASRLRVMSAAASQTKTRTTRHPNE